MSSPQAEVPGTLLKYVCEWAERQKWTNLDALDFFGAHFSAASDSPPLKDLWQASLIDLSKLVGNVWKLLERVPLQTERVEIIGRVSTRNTNWARSSIYAVNSYHLKFASRNPTSVKRSDHLIYLLGVASRVGDLLAIIGGEANKEELQKIESFRSRHSISHVQIRSFPERNKRAVLESLVVLGLDDFGAVKKIREFEDAFQNLFGKDDTQIERLLKLLEEKVFQSRPNLTFEILSALSILNGLIALGYKLEEDKLSAAADTNWAYTLIHQNGPGNQLPPKVYLSKKKPSFVTTDQKGQYQKIVEAMGDRATGLEPDIVIEILHKDGSSKIHIADAKRNEVGNGSGYRAAAVKAAFHYLQSYNMHQDKFTVPEFTLFFLRRGSHIAGETRAQIISADCFPKCDGLPVVGLGFDKGDFEGEIMEKWLKAILNVGD